MAHPNEELFMRFADMGMKRYNINLLKADQQKEFGKQGELAGFITNQVIPGLSGGKTDERQALASVFQEANRLGVQPGQAIGLFEKVSQLTRQSNIDPTALAVKAGYQKGLVKQADQRVADYGKSGVDLPMIKIKGAISELQKSGELNYDALADSLEDALDIDLRDLGGLRGATGGYSSIDELLADVVSQGFPAEAKNLYGVENLVDAIKAFVENPNQKTKDVVFKMSFPQTTQAEGGQGTPLVNVAKRLLTTKTTKEK